MKNNTLRRNLMGGGGKSSLGNQAGDIVYKANGEFKTISYKKWDASLGTPVGVVVVPEGFAPDGRTRMISLLYPNATGNTVQQYEWSTSSINTSVPNTDRVPITTNADPDTISSRAQGYLPSDKFTGPTSYIDPIAKYVDSSVYKIPSPYLGDKPNSIYYSEISGYVNALSDFNGKTNTDTLVALGSDYVAAKTARIYQVAGAEEIEWYLPAAGELGYMIVRAAELNNALKKVNGAQISLNSSTTGTYYWSSTEYNMYYVYAIDLRGYVYNYVTKTIYGYVRPFALLP